MTLLPHAQKSTIRHANNEKRYSHHEWPIIDVIDSSRDPNCESRIANFIIETYFVGIVFFARLIRGIDMVRYLYVRKPQIPGQSASLKRPISPQSGQLSRLSPGMDCSHNEWPFGTRSVWYATCHRNQLFFKQQSSAVMIAIPAAPTMNN